MHEFGVERPREEWTGGGRILPGSGASEYDPSNPRKAVTPIVRRYVLEAGIAANANNEPPEGTDNLSPALDLEEGPAVRTEDQYPEFGTGAH